MKKLIALLLAACLMLGLMTTAFAADEKSNDIVILYTNDVHCAVDDNIGYAGVQGRISGRHHERSRL